MRELDGGLRWLNSAAESRTWTQGDSGTYSLAACEMETYPLLGRFIPTSLHFSPLRIHFMPPVYLLQPLCRTKKAEIRPFMHRFVEILRIKNLSLRLWQLKLPLPDKNYFSQTKTTLANGRSSLWPRFPGKLCCVLARLRFVHFGKNLGR